VSGANTYATSAGPYGFSITEGADQRALFCRIAGARLSPANVERRPAHFTTARLILRAKGTLS
jgi:hypothetical protein